MSSVNEISIRIRYGEEFVEQVENGDADPYTGVKIKADNLFLYGASDRWSKNWVVYLLNSFLESLSTVMNGEKEVVTNHNGPSYFVFEPHSEREVQFTNALTYEGIDDPDKRLSSTESIVIDKIELISEFIDTGEKLYLKIIEINPELEEHNDIILLEKNIEKGRSILSESKQHKS